MSRKEPFTLRWVFAAGGFLKPTVAASRPTRAKLPPRLHHKGFS